MRADLAAYLKTPVPAWDWIAVDCCRWTDGWSVACGNRSAIGLLGLRYRTERGALLTIRRGGGLVALWSRGMALAGVSHVTEPEAGDIGVIKRPTHDGLNETVGIFTGERWASISDTAKHFGPALPLAIWRP